jgi:branched-chain amino acid transport system substrate-binding protein
MRDGMRAAGVEVSTVRITPGRKAYAQEVRRALQRVPSVLYVSTYFPEGAKIAKALGRIQSNVSCLMGLANVDPEFITDAGLDNAQRCVFSGVPEATQLPGPRAARYVDEYIESFNKVPGVWSPFTYDSANILFAAMKAVGTTQFGPVLGELLSTTNYRGATGTITIDPATGNRIALPIYIMAVDDEGNFIPIQDE